MLDIEQQMILFKQKYVEKQELEDEMKLLINEQTLQLDDYRNKVIHLKGHPKLFSQISRLVFVAQSEQDTSCVRRSKFYPYL